MLITDREYILWNFFLLVKTEDFFILYKLEIQLPASFYEENPLQFG
jgi:hypothetical protein